MTLPEILLTRPNIAIVQENREGWKAWYNDFACEIHWLRFWNPACKIIISSPGWTLTGPKPSSISLGHWTFEKSAFKRTLWSTCHQNNGSFINRNVISYISFHLVCPLCPIFFEQRVTEISLITANRRAQFPNVILAKQRDLDSGTIEAASLSFGF